MWLNQMFPFISLSDASSKKLAKFENDIEFQNTFYNLLNISLYSFSFKNLPETCNERYFKLCLILNGYAGLIKDDDIGFITLGVRPVAEAGLASTDVNIAGDGGYNIGLNMYGEYNSVYAYGWNGFNKKYSAYMYGTDNTDAQCVICRDNDICYPFVNYLIRYAKRLTDCLRTLDVTVKKLKNPYFITCDESQKQSVKKILEDIDFNVDSIICNRSTTPNEFNVLQTGVNPEAVRALWEHYSNLQSEIRTLLGINSAANLDKHERLVVDEAEANDILTDINIDYRLKSYQRFCETVNELFGLDISVVSNITRVEQKEEQSNNNDEHGGVDDEVETGQELQ